MGGKGLLHGGGGEIWKLGMKELPTSGTMAWVCDDVKL